MVQNLISYGTMIAMALGVLLWAQTNFVSAMDFLRQQYTVIVDEADYLKDKRLRLQQMQPPQQLIFEDKRKLERLEDQKDLLEQQIKN